LQLQSNNNLLNLAAQFTSTRMLSHYLSHSTCSFGFNAVYAANWHFILLGTLSH